MNQITHLSPQRFRLSVIPALGFGLISALALVGSGKTLEAAAVAEQTPAAVCTTSACCAPSAKSYVSSRRGPASKASHATALRMRAATASAQAATTATVVEEQTTASAAEPVKASAVAEHAAPAKKAAPAAKTSAAKKKVEATQAAKAAAAPAEAAAAGSGEAVAASAGAEAAPSAAAIASAAAATAGTASQPVSPMPMLQDELTLGSLEQDARAIAPYAEGLGKPSAPIYEANGLKVYRPAASTAYPGAGLKLVSPTNGAAIDSNKVPFEFELSKYELGIETPDAAQRGLANSGMGQHIHLIVDDGAYSAHYEPSFTEEISTDGHHIGIAFLSRSYHESVKGANAYEVFQFTTGKDAAVAEEQVDLSQPMLFYSRPKGAYAGAETDKVLLDFYVVNTKLSPTGHQVEVDIDGKDSFRITRWAPYVIEGLSLGEHTITLTLVDAEGKPVASPQGGGKQTIELKPAPADGAAAAPHAH